MQHSKLCQDSSPCQVAHHIVAQDVVQARGRQRLWRAHHSYKSVAVCPLCCILLPSVNISFNYTFAASMKSWLSDLLKEYCEWAIFVANHFCCISLLHCPLWVTLLLVWSCLANRSTEHNLCVPHVVELWSYTHVTNFSLDETAILRKLYNLNKIVVLRVH